MGISIYAKAVMAVRNMVKNRRRSIVTIATITIGFSALGIFEGYFTYVYRALAQEAIYGERLGHLTIVKRDFYEKGSVNPREYVFQTHEFDLIKENIGSLQGVSLISPRLHVSGLVSNGELSHIFMSEGISPEDMLKFRQGENENIPGRLNTNDYSSVSLSSGLAKLLGIDKDNYGIEDLVILTSTIDGMVNASDITVGEVSNTGSVGTNDKFALMSLEMARKLYQFDGADRVVVLLDDTSMTQEVAQEIESRLSFSGLDIEVHDWKTLSVYYTQVKGLFDIMYLFITLVVVVIIISSIVNTMGMSISERTREIGTFRALGMRSRTLTGIFVIEGVVMVLIGCALGTAITYLMGATINFADIRYTPPDASEEASLIIDVLFSNLFTSLIVFTGLAAVVSYFPAKKASRRPITEALGHV